MPLGDKTFVPLATGNRPQLQVDGIRTASKRSLKNCTRQNWGNDPVSGAQYTSESPPHLFIQHVRL